MKKLYVLSFAVLLGTQVWAQKVTLDPTISPTLFKYNDPITVTYDATGTSLASLSSAYIWVWIPGKDTDAKYNVNPATAGIAAAKFNKSIVDGKTLFTLSFTPSDFFTGSIATETKLGMLLKGTDWSNGQTTDYITDFWDGSFQVKLTAPTQNPLFVSTGDDVVITAETPVSADFSLYVDNILTTTQNASTTFAYTHNVTATSGPVTIRISATSGATTEETSFQYLISKISPVAARPEGIIAGINYSGDPTKATLCVLAPGKTSVYVRGDFTDWSVEPEYLMNRDGEYFWLEISGLTAETEYGFQYLLDESVYIADPYADKILDPDDQYIPTSVYPSLKPFPTGALSTNWYFNRVSVLQTNQASYAWQVTDFEKPAKESLVVYELLIRDYFADGSRSYKSLADTISYLKSLGVNAVELMPIMEFNGNESWGYNPAFMFAPDKYYGTKNALKALVDKCHQEGIAVILDIAMNHQDMPNSFLFTDFNFDTYKPNPSNKWFNVDAKHPFNVFFDMNHESLYTKAYLDTINHYWLNEFKVDGFRFDLSKGFTQTNNPSDVGKWGQYDASRIAILKRMADKIWSHTPDAIVILEHFADNAEEKELAEYRFGEGKGMMLWGNLNHAFTQSTMGFSSGSDIAWLDYGTRGWTVPHVVGYMESHDEERMAYKNKQFGAVSGSYSTKDLATSIDRIKAAAVLFYTVPGPKMLWQFGELAYDYSINTCEDGTTISDGCRISEKPVKWDYRDDSRRASLLTYVSDIINIHTSYQVFANGTATMTGGNTLVKQVTLKSNPYTDTPVSTSEMNVQAVANFELTSKKVMVSFPHTGTWYDYYNDGAAINVAATPMEVDLAPGGFKLYTDVSIGSGPTIITAVESPLSETSFSVFPNPTNGRFRISTENQVEFSLMDTRGMRQRLVKNDDEFNIEDLSPGMYILIGMERSGKKSFAKIIKY